MAQSRNCWGQSRWKTSSKLVESGPSARSLTGLRKPWMARFRESDYRAVRRLCDEYLPRPHRAEAVMPGDFPGSTFEPERVVRVDLARRRQHVVSCAVLIHDSGTGGPPCRPL